VRNSVAKNLLSRFGVPVFLLLCLYITTFVHKLNTGIDILSGSNLMMVFQQSTVPILLSLGLSLIMIGGETDLSIAGSIGFTGAVFVASINADLGFWTASALTVAASVLIGVVNGAIVGRLGYSSFLVTISTMSVTLGLQYRFSNGLTAWIADKSIMGISETTVLGLPVFIFIALIIAVVYYVLVYYTKPGFSLRVVGENPAVANEVGTNTRLIKALVFVLASIFYGIAGIIEPLRVAGSVLYSGQTMLLPAMAACYLSSTMFVPGRVNVAGTIFSALFLTFIPNIMTLLNVRYYFVTLIQGLLLIIAVVLSNIRDRSIKQVII